MTSAAERECQRHYQPWLAAHGSAVAVAQHVSSLAELNLQQQGREPLPSRDHTLISFAQNVTLRLNVRRCLISLIDAAHQYVLAEATKSHSSIHPNGAPGDEIWLGSAVLSRPHAVCENSLSSQCWARRENGDEEQFPAEGMIINDCRADRRFAHRPSVMQEESMKRLRFYAGVPLISRNGYKIGVLAVTDENSREGLSANELRYMQDMARCAMGHLEWARDRVDRHKGERVVRGMATFIDEASMLLAHPSRSSQSARRQASPRSSTWRRAPREARRAARKDPDDVFNLAADILRDSTLADGCVIFGATADAISINDRPDNSSSFSGMDRSCKMLSLSLTDRHVSTPLGGTEGALPLHSLYGYYRAFPNGKAFTFTEDAHVASSEEDEGVQTGDDGHLETSNQDSASTEDAGKAKSGFLPKFGTHIKLREMNHSELLDKFPGARSIVFLPLLDPADDRLIAGVFLWTSILGRMADTDLSHVRAFASCIVSEVLRMDVERNEAAKTTFIASMSHELRSPLHGILGAAEFLVETTNNAYEAGLVNSVITCGKTLLDTLNHVLDHSKINMLGNLPKTGGRNSVADPHSESIGHTTSVDLAALVEDVADAVTAGHTFKTLSHTTLTTSSVPLESGLSGSFGSPTSRQEEQSARPPLGVAVLLDIVPKDSWSVSVQQGAIQRIIMNLFGNALKYTKAGFVALSLRTLEAADERNVSVLIRVVDSGNGISKAFQQDRLFIPFQQEDSFQPGTGLGLSIVKKIVDSLHGSIEVKSSPGSGTEVDVYLTLPCHDSPRPPLEMSALDKPSDMHKYPLAMAAKLSGKRLVLLDPFDPSKTRTPVHQAARFQETIRTTCETWFGMQVSRSAKREDDEDVDLYFYGEPPAIEMLRHHKRIGSQRSVPVVLACQNDHDAVAVLRNQQKFLRELGQIVQVIQQPCGPRKLAKTFMYCFDSAEELNSKQRISLTEPPTEAAQADHEKSLAHRPTPASRLSPRATGQELRKSVSAALAPPTPLALDPESPFLETSGDTSLNLLASKETTRQCDTDDVPGVPSSSAASEKSSTAAEKPKGRLNVLLVDDNKINRQLLVMFMKKYGFTYQEAENGKEAVDLFTASNTSSSTTTTGTSTTTATSPAFDYILMDISMPVMDGFEATRRIRALEQQSGLMKKTKVFALTGLASEKAREEAETAGVDLFLPKPVKFADLRGLLG